jgi:hypothetical protein
MDGKCVGDEDEEHTQYPDTTLSVSYYISKK